MGYPIHYILLHSKVFGVSEWNSIYFHLDKIQWPRVNVVTYIIAYGTSCYLSVCPLITDVLFITNNL